ncbi:MAG: hypothetical protein OXG68_04390 [Chloroflexi bacterium]|nr:hypothetical protein [Chloroflexota bacterium]
MNEETTRKTELATKADLQAVEATLIKWIVGTGIAMIAALEFLDRIP